MPHEQRRRKPQGVGSDEPNPMDEENFPDNPTRRSADREMEEPTNVPGSMPAYEKRPRVRETEDDE